MLTGCSSKHDPKSAAQTFLENLQHGNTTAAYESASLAFQTQPPLQEFDTQLKELQINGFQTVHWTSDQIQKNEAKLEGELIKNDGNKLNLFTTFINESGQWRIYELKIRSIKNGQIEEHRFTQVGQNGSFGQVVQQSLPNNNQIKKIVLETLLKFNDAIQQKDFDDFYKSIASDWQLQISQNRMAQAFQGFIDQKIDISAIKESEIKMDEPPFINHEGCLYVHAHAKIPAYQVNFALTYKYEIPNWKLMGITVNCVD